MNKRFVPVLVVLVLILLGLGAWLLSTTGESDEQVLITISGHSEALADVSEANPSDTLRMPIEALNGDDPERTGYEVLVDWIGKPVLADQALDVLCNESRFEVSASYLATKSCVRIDLQPGQVQPADELAFRFAKTDNFVFEPHTFSYSSSRGLEVRTKRSEAPDEAVASFSLRAARLVEVSVHFMTGSDAPLPTQMNVVVRSGTFEEKVNAAEDDKASGSDAGTERKLGRFRSWHRVEFVPQEIRAKLLVPALPLSLTLTDPTGEISLPTSPFIVARAVVQGQVVPVPLVRSKEFLVRLVGVTNSALIAKLMEEEHNGLADAAPEEQDRWSGPFGIRLARKDKNQDTLESYQYKGYLSEPLATIRRGAPPYIRVFFEHDLADGDWTLTVMGPRVRDFAVGKFYVAGEQRREADARVISNDWHIQVQIEDNLGRPLSVPVMLKQVYANTSIDFESPVNVLSDPSGFLKVPVYGFPGTEVIVRVDGAGDFRAQWGRDYPVTIVVESPEDIVRLRVDEVLMESEWLRSMSEATLFVSGYDSSGTLVYDGGLVNNIVSGSLVIPSRLKRSVGRVKGPLHVQLFIGGYLVSGMGEDLAASEIVLKETRSLRSEAFRGKLLLNGEPMAGAIVLGFELPAPILWSLGHQLPMLRPSFPHVKTSESGDFLISRAPVNFGEWSFLHEKHGVLRVLRQEGEILHVAPVTKHVGQLSVDVSKVQLPEGQEFVSFFITPVFEDRRNLTFLNMTFGAELAFGTDNWLSLRHLPFGKYAVTIGFSKNKGAMVSPSGDRVQIIDMNSTERTLVFE